MQLYCKKCNNYITNQYNNIETVYGNGKIIEKFSNLEIKKFNYTINCCCKKSKISSSYLFNVICKGCKNELGWVSQNEKKFIVLDKLSTIRA